MILASNLPTYLISSKMRKSATAAVLALAATSSMAQMLPSEIFGLSYVADMGDR